MIPGSSRLNQVSASSRLLSGQILPILFDMTFDLILRNIAKHIALDKDETDRFISFLAYKEIPKKTCLLSEGQACKYLSYVHSGALRSYCLDKGGKESTIMFAV